MQPPLNRRSTSAPSRPTCDDDAALRDLIEEMRVEIAIELGLSGVEEGYFGEWTNAACGRYGMLLYSRAKALLDAAAPHNQVRPSG